jgi:hypothetical protein
VSVPVPASRPCSKAQRATASCAGSSAVPAAAAAGASAPPGPGSNTVAPPPNARAAWRAIERAASRSSSAAPSSRVSAWRVAARSSRARADCSCRRMRCVSVLITTPTTNIIVKVRTWRASSTAKVWKGGTKKKS